MVVEAAEHKAPPVESEELAVCPNPPTHQAVQAGATRTARTPSGATGAELQG
jgi:hypothetical protein